jgi:hypothetical protein
MFFTKSTAWTLILVLTVGCSSEKHATLFQGDGKQIRVAIAAKTGKGIEASIAQALPSGTTVTILDDSSSESFMQVRIDTGEFQGQVATVSRNALRIAE